MRAGDRTLLGNKSGTTRFGFAVLLKLFQTEGCFPRRPEDVPVAAVEVLAAQVGVPVAAWRGYEWRGRTIEYHRAQIRAALGFREATLDGAEALGRWLDGQALTLERRHDRLLAAACERCRALKLELPSPERLEALWPWRPPALWGCVSLLTRTPRPHSEPRCPENPLLVPDFVLTVC